MSSSAAADPWLAPPAADEAAGPDAPGQAGTRLVALVLLLRPLNVVLAAAAVLIGALAATDGAALEGARRPLWLAAAVGATGTAYGNVLNDLHDHVLDRRAHPRRPLPSGRVTRTAAWNLAFALWLATIAFAALVTHAFLLLTVVLLAALFAYERRLKARGLVGNVLVAAAAGALFPLGALAYPQGTATVPLLLGLVAAFAHLGRELLKDAEDATHERDLRRTFATVHGAPAAAQLGRLFLATALVVAPLPHLYGDWGDGYLLALLPAVALFVGAIAHARRHPGRGRAWAKAAMVAAVGAFVVGALTAA